MNARKEAMQVHKSMERTLARHLEEEAELFGGHEEIAEFLAGHYERSALLYLAAARRLRGDTRLQ